MEIPQVYETEINGVRTFWVDTPPPLVAALAFRVGSWDERLPMRGVTHLVEHLSLFEQHDRTHPHNGVVTGNQTMLWASGASGDVSSFLREVTASLGALPLERLATESRVLRAEGAQRQRSYLNMILAGLFANRGPGVANHPEWGLYRLEPPAVQAWADRHFTAGNAVLMLTGPPPDDLALDLPPGEHDIFRVPEPGLDLRPQQREAWGTQPNGIAMGTLVERTTAATMAVRLAQLRLTEKLRHDHGLAYAVYPAYERLDPDLAFAYLAADCETDRRNEMGERFVATLDELAEEGPREAEMVKIRAPGFDPDLVSAADAARHELHRAGNDYLTGTEHRSLQALLAEQEEVTAGRLAEVVHEIADYAAAIVPEPALDGMAVRAAYPADAKVDGKEYPRGALAENGNAGPLVFGESGMSIELDGDWVTFPWGEVELVVEHGDDLELHRLDGRWVRFDPSQWHPSVEVAGLLEEKFDKSVRVRIPERPAPDGGPESTSTASAEAVVSSEHQWSQRSTLPGRVPRKATPQKTRLQTVLALLVIVAAFVYVGITGFDSGNATPAIAASAAAVSAAQYVRSRKRGG